MKVLIIGASALQVPAIKQAKSMGHTVAVIDYNQNAVGIQDADFYACCSTNDIPCAVEFAAKFQPDGVMTMATDMPMRTVAKIAEQFGLRSISYPTAVRCTDKYEMIQALSANDVPSPWYVLLRNTRDIAELIANGKVTFPCIMKPTDLSGSRGVLLCNNPEELSSGFDYAISFSHSKEVLIEEYMRGDEVSVEIFVTKDDIIAVQVTDKLTTGAPYFVEKGHSQPSQQKNIQEIKRVAIAAVRALGIETGPAHVEIMCTPSGPKIIEVGARLGGDYIASHLVPLSTGVNMVENTIKDALGQEVDLRTTHNKASANRFILPKTAGTISKLRAGAYSIDGVIETIFSKKIGDFISPVNNSGDRIGCVIAQADSSAQAIVRCEQALKEIEIDMRVL